MAAVLLVAALLTSQLGSVLGPGDPARRTAVLVDMDRVYSNR